MVKKPPLRVHVGLILILHGLTVRSLGLAPATNRLLIGHVLLLIFFKSPVITGQARLLKIGQRPRHAPLVAPTAANERNLP